MEKFRFVNTGKKPDDRRGDRLRDAFDKKKYLFFDTETNGLPKNYKASASDVDNWPRIIQLAWALYEGKKQIEGNCFLIKPNGWEIPKQKFWIENGYSTEKSMQIGFPIDLVFYEFLQCYENCDYIIAHNYDFDEKVLGAELYRSGIVPANSPDPICTMKESIDFCQIPNEYGYASFKWPKLQELHEKLFDSRFENAHDALADVKACAKCFFELQKLGVVC